MYSLKVRKISKSLGIILPSKLISYFNITEGDSLDITVIDRNKINIETHLQHHSQWRFDNTELSTEDKDWLKTDLEN